MRRIIFGIFATLVLTIGFASCSNDDSDSPFSGKWYLRDYSNYATIMDNPDLNKCTWGEYIQFDGSKMYWNSQYHGENETYNFTTARDTEICLTNNNGDVQVFIVKKHTKDVLVVYCADDTYRYFTR